MKTEYTIIEVESYGDYDIKSTVCIMVSTEKLNVDDVINNYCSLIGIPSTNGLPDNMLSDTTNDFIKHLEGIGFKKLKTKKVCFTD